MKRIVLATTIALACISASGQEQQDSLKSVSMMQELQEVVVKGNLPNIPVRSMTRRCGPWCASVLSVSRVTASVSTSRCPMSTTCVTISTVRRQK